MTTIAITTGFAEADRAAIVALLRDYESGLDVALDFQGFAAEMATLPGAYAPPGGAMIIARADGTPVGLVALRSLDARAGICEMKRLYIAPGSRGHGLGRRLAQAAIAEARRLGYRRLRLDTLPAMVPAQQLYRGLGFREIANYNGNPVAGTRFMELCNDSEAPSP